MQTFYTLQEFVSFFVWLLLLTHCRCRGLLLHLITLNDTHTHTHTHTHSVGLFWMRDLSVAGTCTWQHAKFSRDRHPCPRWNSNPQSYQV